MITQPKIWFIGPVAEYSDAVQYSTIEECYNYLKDKMEIGEDIETTYKFPKNTYKNEQVYSPGLDPYLSKVVMLQLGTKEQVFVIDTRSVDISILLPLWGNKERLWIGHNLKFEVKHLLHNYGIIHHKIYDTMLVEQNLTNGLSLGYSLEKLAGRYLGIKPVEKQKDLFVEEDEDAEYIDKSIRMGFLTIGSKPFTEEQILYGADDITYPIEIKKKQALGYNGYKPVQVNNIENEFCLVLADIELKGMTFDQEQWLKTYEENLVIYQKRKEKLDKWVVDNFKEDIKFCSVPDLFNTNIQCTIEWSSSNQVIVLMKKLGYCPQEKSKSTGYVEYTVGAKALLKLLPSKYKEMYMDDKETDIVDPKNDLILNYLLFKTSEQSCTTFGKDFLKYVHPITGRLHSSYRQILNTGRMCVDVDTLIDTNIGYIRIGNLIPTIEGVLEYPEGIKAKTHTGKYHPITHGINKGVEEMYRVTLESGHEIICTMNHKFLTEKGWYSLKEIVSSPTEYTILYDESY